MNIEEKTIYVVQAQGFGVTEHEWENVAAFSTKEFADAYKNKLRNKSAEKFKSRVRTVQEAFNPIFSYGQ